MAGRCRRLHRVDDGVEVKLIRMPLSRHFVEDKFVIIESKSTTHVVIIHGGLVFPLAPFPSHCIRVHHSKFSTGSFPANAIFIFFLREKFQKELPQFDLTTALKNKKYLILYTHIKTKHREMELSRYVTKIVNDNINCTYMKEVMQSFSGFLQTVSIPAIFLVCSWSLLLVQKVVGLWEIGDLKRTGSVLVFQSLMKKKTEKRWN